jgi:hypothetical protein
MRALMFLLALCALAAVGCGGETATEEAPTTPPAETTTPPAEASNRPPAPVVEGESLDGKRISLADYRGRAVVVNVWSSW